MKNHLKALRESHGWTQGALADQLGVSRQTVNALETGRYDPALPLAFRIARLFAQPIESIFVPQDASISTPDRVTR
jgi:putative transcriptional regulator